MLQSTLTQLLPQYPMWTNQKWEAERIREQRTKMCHMMWKSWENTLCFSHLRNCCCWLDVLSLAFLYQQLIKFTFPHYEKPANLQQSRLCVLLYYVCITWGCISKDRFPRYTVFIPRFWGFLLFIPTLCSWYAWEICMWLLNVFVTILSRDWNWFRVCRFVLECRLKIN